MFWSRLETFIRRSWYSVLPSLESWHAERLSCQETGHIYMAELIAALVSIHSRLFLQICTATASSDVGLWQRSKCRGSGNGRWAVLRTKLLCFLMFSDTFSGQISQWICKSSCIEFKSGDEVHTNSRGHVRVRVCYRSPETWAAINKTTTQHSRDTRVWQKPAECVCTGCHEHHLWVVR